MSGLCSGRKTAARPTDVPCTEPSAYAAKSPDNPSGLSFFADSPVKLIHFYILIFKYFYYHLSIPHTISFPACQEILLFFSKNIVKKVDNFSFLR